MLSRHSSEPDFVPFWTKESAAADEKTKGGLQLSTAAATAAEAADPQQHELSHAL